MANVRALFSLTGLLLFCEPVIAETTTPADSPTVARPAGEVVHIRVIESSDLRVRRISTHEGLSQTRVQQVVQDDRGFIWFGTQYGLDRYDGYDFKVFVHDPKSKNSLSGTFVTALFKDRDGALWIGCNGVLDRMDPRTEVFTHYAVDSGAPNGGGPVVHISQDQKGMLWIATGTGLHRLDPATSKISHFRHESTAGSGLSTNDINWSGQDSHGHLWVGSASGLDEFDPETRLVTYHIPIGDPVRVRFFEDHLGKFWVASATGTGLALLDRDSNTLTSYSFYSHSPQSSELSGVLGIIEDHEGDLWLGSPRLGLLRLDRQRFQLVHYGSRPADPRSIAEDKVIELFADRDDNIWVGLHSKAPNVFARSSMAFETFQHDPADPQSLTVDFVNAIYEDSEGMLWIGNDSGLNQIDRINHRRKTWAGASGATPMVIAIAEGPSHQMWFGTYDYGLGRLDPKTGHLRSYRHNPSNSHSLSNDYASQIFVDRSGTLWVGTDDGLNRYNPQTDDFTVYKFDWNDRRAQSYFAMDQDAAGTLWLGTHYSGLHHFDPEAGRVIQVYRATRSGNSVLDDMAVAVHVARNGHIWVGTQNGLNELDPRSGQMKGYDIHDGLPGNAVRCVLEDDAGDLWVGTNRGLSHLSQSAKTFINYSEEDGLPGDDLTGWYACFHRAGGEIFMGGFPGAIAFRPSELQDPKHVPSVVLTDFRLSGREVSIGPDTPLKQSIPYTRGITLQHEQRTFSVAFAGLNYFAPRTTRYRYRLEGLDKEWTEVTSEQRLATYTTLPPGAYTLNVQAASSRGAWNESGMPLHIEVLPPWWQTWWFRTSYVVGLCALLYSFHLMRLRKAAREFKMRLRDRVDERTRIAQELHDTLLQGLLSASLQLEVANTDISHDHPVKPQTTAVFNMLRQLIDEGRNTLRGLRSPQRGAVVDLAESLASATRDLRPSGAKFELVIEGKPRPLRPFVVDEVYRIGREALVNAFRHSGALAIELLLEYGTQHFRLVVRDDGKGIASTVLQSGRAGHWGLSGMRERSSRIMGKLKIRSAANAGTEIDLIVAASAAYEPAVTSRWRGWLGKLYSQG